MRGASLQRHVACVEEFLASQVGAVVRRKDISKATGIESKTLTRTMRLLASRGRVREGVSFKASLNERVYVVREPAVCA